MYSHHREKGDLAAALETAGRDITRMWVQACDAMIARAGATHGTHVLVSEPQRAPDQPFYRAWLVPNGEPWKPVRYPCVEMAMRDDLEISIALVDDPAMVGADKEIR